MCRAIGPAGFLDDLRKVSSHPQIRDIWKIKVNLYKWSPTGCRASGEQCLYSGSQLCPRRYMFTEFRKKQTNKQKKPRCVPEAQCSQKIGNKKFPTPYLPAVQYSQALSLINAYFFYIMYIVSFRTNLKFRFASIIVLLKVYPTFTTQPLP